MIYINEANLIGLYASIKFSREAHFLLEFIAFLFWSINLKNMWYLNRLINMIYKSHSYFSHRVVHGSQKIFLWLILKTFLVLTHLLNTVLFIYKYSQSSQKSSRADEIYHLSTIYRQFLSVNPFPCHMRYRVKSF